MKMNQQTAPSETILNPNHSTNSECNINDKILAKKYNSNINVPNTISSYNDDETSNCSKKLKIFVATNATTKPVALTGPSSSHSVQKAFTIAIVFESLSKTIDTI